MEEMGVTDNRARKDRWALLDPRDLLGHRAYKVCLDLFKYISNFSMITALKRIRMLLLIPISTDKILFPILVL